MIFQLVPHDRTRDYTVCTSSRCLLVQIIKKCYKTRQFFYIDYESDIFLSFSHCVIGLASEQERQDYVVHTRNEWVATFFSLSVGWQKNTLDFMGILRRREPSSPVLQALRWLCSINFGLPNHHIDLNKNINLIWTWWC